VFVYRYFLLDVVERGEGEKLSALIFKSVLLDGAPHPTRDKGVVGTGNACKKTGSHFITHTCHSTAISATQIVCHLYLGLLEDYSREMGHTHYVESNYEIHCKL